MTPNSTLFIHSPSMLDVPICHLMLPQTLAYSFPFEYRLAADPATCSTVGAIAFADSGAQLHLLALRTIPGHSSISIATHMVDHLLTEAARRGYAKVSAAVSPAEAAPLHSFLRKRGFEVRERLHTSEADFAPGYKRLSVRCRGVTQTRSGDSPILPLTEATLPRAEQLYAEYLAGLGAPQGIRRFFPHLTDLALSRALIIGDAIQGVVLITRHRDTAEIEARIVRPQFRRTRGSAALLMHALNACAEAGVQRLRFSYLDSAHDTAAVVRRMQMQVVNTVDLLARPVAATAAILTTSPTPERTVANCR